MTGDGLPRKRQSSGTPWVGLARKLSGITQTDLTPHFNAWTIAITQAAMDECAAYPLLTQEIWLIDGAEPMHNGSGSGAIRHEW